MTHSASEYRFDPLREHWVIIAPDRARRPRADRAVESWHEETPCPFCPGNERQTPPEIMALRPDSSRADAPGWRVRVVPNMYPAVVRCANGIADGVVATQGSSTRAPGYGAHEVVIETPDHEAPMAARPPADLVLTLKAFRERLRALRKDRRIQYVQAFKNSGLAAGATRRHPHSQIVATTILPPTVVAEQRVVAARKERRCSCLICERVERATANEDRLVYANRHFAVFCPYASRLPFESCIAPMSHRADYVASSDEELLALAEVLAVNIAALARVLADPPFNLVLRTCPSPHPAAAQAGGRGEALADFHWRFEVLPRTSNLAGFEWGAGVYINHVAPETAARQLREAL